MTDRIIRYNFWLNSGPVYIDQHLKMVSESLPSLFNNKNTVINNGKKNYKYESVMIHDFPQNVNRGLVQ